MIFIIGLIVASIFLFILWLQSQAKEQALESSETEKQLQSNRTQIAKDKTEEKIAQAKEKNAGLQAEAEENRLLADISDSQARTVHNKNAAQSGVDGETYKAQILGQGAFQAEIEKLKLESQLRVQEKLAIDRGLVETSDYHERVKDQRLKDLKPKELGTQEEEPAQPKQEKKGAKNERKR